MKKITIAIDGFSSTGKSTIAKQLAAYLGYVYVDTGAMYRAIALFALQNELISEDYFYTDKLIEKLPEISLEFRKQPGSDQADIHLNGNNVEKEIRKLEVSQYVSQIAQVSEVRAKLVEQQQLMGKNKGIVMDGRDIGTVVFPDAELKIFLTADAAERAERRYQEYREKGEEVSYDDILENVLERDFLDSNRKDSPLRKAEDAIEIDNTFTSKEDQFHIILQLAKDRIAGRV